MILHTDDHGPDTIPTDHAPPEGEPRKPLYPPRSTPDDNDPSKLRRARDGGRAGAGVSMEDDEEFISLVVQRTNRFQPQVIVLAKPRSEDMRVVADAEIQARPNNVVTVEVQRRVISFP